MVKNKMPKRTRSGSRMSRQRRVISRLTYGPTRRPRKSRISRSLAAKAAIHPHHRWINALPAGNVSTSNCSYSSTTSIITCNRNVTESDFATYFTLADLPDNGEFSTLYDQYKLMGVKFQFKLINVPESTIGLNQTSSSYVYNYGQNYYPTIWYAPDHDDNNAISLNNIREYSRVKHKVLRPNKEISIYVRPTTLQQLYLSGVSAGYACNFKPTWVDMAQTNVPHYGLKAVIDFEGLTTNNDTAQSQWQIKVNAKYYFMCKNAR